MTELQYRLGVAGGAHGPGDFPEVTVIASGYVRGPDEPNWQHDFLLLRCVPPFRYAGDEVLYLVAAPRYATDALGKIRDEGGIVGVARVLPNHVPQITRQIQTSHVSYLGAGVLRPCDS